MMNDTNNNIIDFSAYSSLYGLSAHTVNSMYHASQNAIQELEAGELRNGDDDLIPALMDWLDDKLESGNIRRNTYNKYCHYVEDTIAPYFSENKRDEKDRLKIKNIKKNDVQKFINFCNTTKKIAPKTIRDIIGSVLKPFYNDMMDDYNAVEKNPCERVKMPKVRTISDKKAYTEEEQKRLAHVLPRTHYLYISIPLLLSTGIRRSELLGLTWDDVDFDNHTIHIHQTNVAVEGEKTEVKEETKTDASNRYIAMNPALEEKLLFHRKTVQHGKRKYVISQLRNNKPVDPNNFSRAYRKWCKKAGVEGSPHTTRHTYITNLTNMGMNPITIKQQTGHTDTRMIEYYTDNSKISDSVRKMQNEYGEKMKNILD